MPSFRGHLVGITNETTLSTLEYLHVTIFRVDPPATWTSLAGIGRNDTALPVAYLTGKAFTPRLAPQIGEILVSNFLRTTFFVELVEGSVDFALI